MGLSFLNEPKTRTKIKTPVFLHQLISISNRRE